MTVLRNKFKSLVEIRDLSFYREERAIFEGVNINIPKGKITGIMGPSGTGKTTLLRLIGGQLTPKSGEILFGGVNIPTLSRTELYKQRKKMAMLFQSGALFTDMNVFENVAFPIREHTELPEELVRVLVLMKLEAVGLRGANNLMPSELSGGMARRAALARAIALEPELIMYDEPFVGQDPIAMGVLVKLIKKLNDSLALTSIVVSHDVKELMGIVDYAYVIAESHVIAYGTPEQLKCEQNPQLRQFMDGLADGPVPFQYPAIDYRADLVRAGESK